MFELLEAIVNSLALIGELNNPDERKRKSAQLGCLLLVGVFIVGSLGILAVVWIGMGQGR